MMDVEMASTRNPDDIFVFVQDYFNQHGFCRQQIESYEHFMDVTLKSIINNMDPLDVKCARSRIVVTLRNVTIMKMYHKIMRNMVHITAFVACKQRFSTTTNKYY